MNDNYLAHHGVKGMKWGVRHDRREGRLYRARNHMRNLTGSRSSDALKEARQKDINQMSNRELQETVNRLNLERQYRQLTQADIGFGQRKANEVLSYEDTYRKARNSAAYKAGKQVVASAM